METIRPWLIPPTRLLWRDSSLVIIALLALGIGSAVAVFSIVNTVLLRTPPYMEGLVAVEAREPRDAGPGGASYPDFLDWKTQSRSLDDMVAISGASGTLKGVDSPEYLEGLAVSPDFAHVLKLKPLIGRTFLDSEFKPGQQPRRYDQRASLAEAFWRRQKHIGTANSPRE